MAVDEAFLTRESGQGRRAAVPMAIRKATYKANQEHHTHEVTGDLSPLPKKETPFCH